MNKFYSFLHRHRYDIFFSILLVLIIAFMFIVFPKEETKNIIKAMEYVIMFSATSKNVAASTHKR